MFTAEHHLFLKRFNLLIGLCFQSIPLLLFVIFFLPIALSRRKKNNPWVISGHKGKCYEDNSKALHEFIITKTDQEIIWISACPRIAGKLEEKGAHVMRKHSFSARMAIFKAPVLLYSHGEDDLDNFLILFRGMLGKRIYLSHTLDYLKGPARKKKEFLLTGFDYALAVSEEEKKNIEIIFPDKKDRIVLGGGAHLDQFFRAKETEKENIILYFPTHRESHEGIQEFSRVIGQIMRSSSLAMWLRDNNFQFAICRHVNSPERHCHSKENLFIEIPAERLIEYMIKCSLFISDYSGTLANFLILDKPAIFFPFDLDGFLTKRTLFYDYDECCYGPRANTLDGLVALITKNDWKSDEFMKRDCREKWYKKMFPYAEAVYAQKSYESIKECVRA